MIRLIWERCTMAQAIGTVKSLNGLVIARTPDGHERVLAVGDRVDMHEIIITNPGANIVIALDNGNEIQLDASKELALDDTLVTPVDQHDAQAQADAIQHALEHGDNIQHLEGNTATGDVVTEGHILVGYLPGDMSGGSVGSYLLGSYDTNPTTNTTVPGAGNTGSNNTVTTTTTTDTGTTTDSGSGTDTGSGTEPTPVSYTLNDPSSVPEGFSIDADGKVTFDSSTGYDYLSQGETVDFSVNYTITYSDGTTAQAVYSFEVVGTNDLPVATSGDISAVEGAAIVAGQLTATDVDHLDTLSFSLADPNNVPAGFTLNADGSYTFDPTNAAYDHLAAGQQQTITVDYIVSDDKGGTATETITLTVTGTNDAPVAVAHDSFAATEGGETVTGQLAVTDVDDGAAHTFALADGVTAPEGFALNADGSYSFDPTNAAYDHLAEGDTQTISVDYVVTDDKGAVSTETLTFTVEGTNDAPVTVNDSFAVGSDGHVEFTLAADATDIEDDALGHTTSIVVDSLPEHGTLYYEGSPVTQEMVDAGFRVDDSSHLTYEADPNYSGTVLMGTKDASGVADQWGTAENGVLTFNAGNGNSATITAYDTHGNQTTVGFNNQINNEHGLGIGVTGGGDSGQIDTGESIVVNFESAVSNAVIGLGGLGGNFDTVGSPVAQAHWEAYLNGELVASGETYRDGDFVKEINLTDTVFDSIKFYNTSEGGNSNFVVQYMEYTNAHLTDSFNYSAVDSDGLGSNQSVVSFDIAPGAVLEHNVAPEAADKVVDVSHDGTAQFNLTAESSDYNDDTDNDPSTNSHIRIESLPEHGHLEDAGGHELHVGDTVADADSIVYKFDGDTADNNVVLMGSKGDGTINDWGTVHDNGTVTFEAGGVTATIAAVNGTVGFSDYSGINSDQGFGLGVTTPGSFGDDGQIDLGQTLTVNFDQAVSNATVGLAGLGNNFAGTINAAAHWEALLDGQVVASGDVQRDGDNVNSFSTGDVHFDQLVFTVHQDTNTNSNYTLQYIEFGGVTNDHFSYVTVDSDGAVSNPATVAFDIEPSATLTAEHAPVAADDHVGVNEDHSVTFSVVANDIDADGGTLSVHDHTNPEHGVLTDNGDGTFTYTPSADYFGSDSFSYTVVDDSGNESTATVNIDVNPVNDAPVITIDNSVTDVHFTSDGGSYHNAFGVYVTDADGNPVSGEIILNNSDHANANDLLASYNGDGSNLHYFIISNVAENFQGGAVTFDNSGNLPVLEVNGHATSYNVFYSDASLNADGINHFHIDTNGDITTIGVEDLYGGGDKDYNDLMAYTETHDGIPTYTEGHDAVSVVNGDVSITDVDNTTMHSVTVTLTNMADGDVLSVNESGLNGISYQVNGNSVTFTNTAAEMSTADYEHAIKAVMFGSTSIAPDTADRVFEISVNDGQADSNVAQTIVHVEGVNEVPFIDLSGSENQLILSESFENFNVGSDWNVFHGDSAGHVTGDAGVVWSLNSAGIEIQGGTTGGSAASDGYNHAELDTHSSSVNAVISTTVDTSGSDHYELTFDYKPRPGYADSSDMKVSFGSSEISIDSDSHGHLTVTAPDGVEVTYQQNDSGWFTFTVMIAGVEAATTDLSFAGAGNVDTLGAFLDNISLSETVAGGTGYEATFSGEAVSIADAGVMITDVDSTHLESAKVVIENYHTGDTLNLGDLGSLQATTEVVDGKLVVNLEGHGTLADYQHALHDISFSTTSSDTADRDISVTVNDGTDDSNVAHTNIHVDAGVHDYSVDAHFAQVTFDVDGINGSGSDHNSWQHSGYLNFNKVDFDHSSATESDGYYGVHGQDHSTVNHNEALAFDMGTDVDSLTVNIKGAVGTGSYSLYDADGHRVGDFESIHTDNHGNLTIDSDTPFRYVVFDGDHGNNTYVSPDYSVQPVSVEASDGVHNTYAVLDESGGIDFGSLHGVDAIQLANNHQDTNLSLTVDDVLKVEHDSSTLQITGGSGDSLNMSEWTHQGDGVFTAHTDQGTATVQITGDFSFDAGSHIITFGHLTDDGHETGH